MTYSLNKQPFSEESIPIPYNCQFRARICFDTIVNVNLAGREQRFPKLTEYQLKVNLSDLIITKEEADTLLEFFRDRKGTFISFRFRFWGDYAVTAQKAVLDESGSNVISTQGQFFYGGETETGKHQYQLLKVYQLEGNNQSWFSYKTINKPVFNSDFKIFKNGEELTTGWTLNTATGVLTFDEKLTGELDEDGNEIPPDLTWQGLFDHSMRFDRDSIPELLLVEEGEDNRGWYRFDSLPIIEELSTSQLPISYPEYYDNLSYSFSFSYKPEETVTPKFENFQQETRNKRTFRESRQGDKPVLEIPSLIESQGKELIDDNKADAFIALFVLAKGRLLKFSLQNRTNVRFDIDELEIEPLNKLYDSETPIPEIDRFRLQFNNLEFVFEELLIDEETYITLYFDSSGSMNEFQTAITEGLNLAKEDLTASIYLGDSQRANQYIQITDFSDEEWLRWSALDPRQSTEEPKKQVVLSFINESEPVYHNMDGEDNSDEPTVAYSNHYDDFTNYVSDADIYLGRIVFINDSFPQGGLDAFIKHANNAVKGDAPYDQLGVGLRNVQSEGLYRYFDPATLDPELDLEDPELYRNIIINSLTGSILDSGFSLEVELLSGEVNPIARCVLIERVDGKQIGFTDHDRDIRIGGVTYKSQQAINPTNIENKADLSVNNSELASVLATDAISESDVIAGKYRDAEVTIFIVDFSNPPETLDNAQILQTGLVGEITLDSLGYTFEILSKVDTLLNRSSSKKISPICPYEFGDSDCKFDISNVTQSVTVASKSAGGGKLTFDEQLNAGVSDVANYSYGKVTATSGLNQGLSEYILKQLDSNKVELFKPLPYIIEIGDTLEIVQGCAKTATACKAYNNFNNFGGFPTDGNFMPGNDFIFNALE